MIWKNRILWMAFGLLTWNSAWAQTTTRVSVDSAGVQANGASNFPVLTPDGRFVAFESNASNLVAGDTNGFPDVFVHDRQTGQTTRASLTSSGGQATWGGGQPAISADGRYVAFQGASDDLVAGDTNGTADIFLRDRTTGQTTRVSLDPSGAQLTIHSSDPCMSDDGRYIAFYSWDDTLTTEAIYVRDVVSAATSLASADSGGTALTGGLANPSISADGRLVGFDGYATSLPGDSGPPWDVFVRDRQAGTTVLFSTDSLGAAGNGPSGLLEFSPDGMYGVFDSGSNNLVPGDTNNQSDTFLKDIGSGAIERVDLDSTGAQSNGQSLRSPPPSGDVRFVAFTSAGTNLVPGDTNGKDDVFLRDRRTGITTRVSVGTSGAQALGHSGGHRGVSLSGDGRFVAFGSDDSFILMPGDTNGVSDVFVRDRMPAAVISFCLGDGTGAACPCANSGHAYRGCQNSVTSGGSVVDATGVASLGSDTLRMTSYAGRASALSLFWQGDASIGPVNFGDGLRCFGGNLKRLFYRNASGGVVTAPQGADPSVSSRSAALGDALSPGAVRYYQVQYRDPVNTYCPDPPGGPTNSSQALEVTWSP